MSLIKCTITWTVTQGSEKSQTVFAVPVLQRSLSFTSAVKLFILTVLKARVGLEAPLRKGKDLNNMVPKFLSRAVYDFERLCGRKLRD